MLTPMSPDPSGGAPPRDPGPGDDEPTTASFRAGAEQVDESAAAARTDSPGPREGPRGRAAAASTRGKGRIRARKVHRIVRHIEPWSVLKISVLFFLAVFMIICVASAVLWNGARSSGSIENVEDFITEVGGFGNCPEVPPTTTTTTVPPDPAVSTTTTAPTTTTTIDPLEDDDEDCPGGAALEGSFKFEDDKIFQAFALGGIVLVLAGSASTVVMALLFNLISDLTGGMRITVLEEEPAPRTSRTGSPKPKRGD